jgi:hypothetical protein
VWTWKRLDGSEYEAGGIPALWRRVADRPNPAAAQCEFGPLDEAGFFAGESFAGGDFASPNDFAGQADWPALHGLLTSTANLWRPSAKAPEISDLDAFQLQRDPAVERLRVIASQVAVGGEITPRLEGWQLQFRPMSLRAGLVMGVVADIGGRRRFRRCDQCGEWFSFARTTARFCSSACRAAAHSAGKSEE